MTFDLTEHGGTLPHRHYVELFSDKVPDGFTQVSKAMNLTTVRDFNCSPEQLVVEGFGVWMVFCLGDVPQ